MTKNLYGLCGALAIVGICSTGQALADPRDAEEVTVGSPYTIRQQAMTRSLRGQMQETRITVESRVSYAGLDFGKQADVDTMKERIRTAARDNCRELDRRFPSATNIPVGEDNCVKDATLHSLGQLDDVRATAGRIPAGQSARN
jgi:UrcA family protein